LKSDILLFTNKFYLNLFQISHFFHSPETLRYPSLSRNSQR